MPAILSLHAISKNYGIIRALNNVSFSVPEGCVFGILGPNGSGKTTLLSIVLDILKPTTGNFQLFGEEPSPSLRRRMGTLLETPNFYHYLSGEDNLVIAAGIKGKGKEDIPTVLEKTGLLQRKNSRFSTYSLGMKQRLAIAAALLGDPSVLLFDEPTNGLDPSGIAEIRTLIKQLAKEGKTIIMASHLLDEVEKVCTHVAILKRGDLLTAGPVNEVLVNEDIVEMSAKDLAQLAGIIQRYPTFKSLKTQDGMLQVSFSHSVQLDEVNRFCFEQGTALSSLQLRKKSLEAKFIELTEPNSPRP